MKLLYRKLPLVSPGLIQLRKRVLDGLINGGSYIRGGYNRIKKSVSKRVIAVLILLVSN